MGGVGGMLAWVACLRGWRVSIGDMLTCVTWVACLRGLRGCRATVGDLGGLCLRVHVCFISM